MAKRLNSGDIPPVKSAAQQSKVTGVLYDTSTANSIDFLFGDTNSERSNRHCDRH